MKRILRVVLSAMMVFSVISVNVRAEEDVELSQFTEGLFEYELSNGELTITGFDKTYSGAIEIPDQIDGDRVTAIGDSAFWGAEITEVTIPDGVTTIGERAFRHCENLESINLPSGITIIEAQTFLECSRLKDIVIPNGVTSIGFQAFSNCESLVSITIPSSVTSIGYYAFLGSGLTSIVIPKSVTSIAYEAFGYCEQLKKVTIPASVQEMGESAFAYCTSLTDVTFENNLNTMANSLFEGCINLKNITIPDTVKTIEDDVFYDCESLSSIIIPDSVTTIGRWAFNGCKNLKKVFVPKSVKEIGLEAFGFYYDWDSSKMFPIQGFTIYGVAGTAAEKYAKDNGIKFVSHSTHNWNTGKTLKSATCTTNGLKLSTCTTCGHQKKEVIPASHSFNIYDKCTKCSKYASYINTSVPKMTVKSISKAKGALTVKWKKNTKVKGYQVRYSLKSNMSSAKTVKITKNKTTSKKIKSLKKKTKYYVQIRAYQTIGGKTMYSPWSAVKSQTTK